ncbi:hypothetical protein BJY52DRAFT_1193420 [Lactarius psammicola]|nr:hypothetical protein BJY52DRAFT_1193420 [Lactarius psammicola]
MAPFYEVELWKQEYGDMFYLNAAGQPMSFSTPRRSQQIYWTAVPKSFLTARATSSLRKFSAAAWSLCFGVMGHYSGVKVVDDFVAHLKRAGLPGTHSVEFLPWMRFPKWKRGTELCWSILFLRKQTLWLTLLQSEGIDRPGLGTLIKDAENYGLFDWENSCVAAIRSTRHTLHIPLLLIEYQRSRCGDNVGHPNLVDTRNGHVLRSKKACLGRARRSCAHTPTFADFQHLPYIRAVVKEASRRLSVDPIGLPRFSTEDNWCDGMFIPKDAAHFDPERFLDTNGGVFPSPTVAKEEGHVTYDFQRSICAGSTLRTLLRLCGQELGKDEHDNVTLIDVDRWVEDGLVRRVHFKADISPRFPGAAALLTDERKFQEH